MSVGMPNGFFGIPARKCECGEWMQFNAHVSGAHAYVCHHCDEPCAGVATTARCELCARIAVKRS